MNTETITDGAECLPTGSCPSQEPLEFLVHEVRNALACIEFAIETLLLVNAMDQSTVKLYRMIQRQIEHTNHLMGTLNNPNRCNVECPLTILRKQEYSLTDLIDQVAELNEPMILGAGHQFALSNCEKTIRVNADPARFVQIFSNLLQNASKYTPSGGCIELIAECPGKQATVIVRDNGCGIDPDFLPRMFSLRARSDQAQNSAISGSGVGLALTKHLVEAHDWVIKVDSSAAGSQFTVSMPVIERSENSAADPIDATPARVLGGGGVEQPRKPGYRSSETKKGGHYCPPFPEVVAMTGAFT